MPLVKDPHDKAHKLNYLYPYSSTFQPLGYIIIYLQFLPLITIWCFISIHKHQILVLVPMNLDLQLQQIMLLWTICKFRSWEAMTKLKIVTTLTYLGLQPSLRHKKGCGWEKCVKTLSHSHTWNGAKRRWIPNTYKWESLWKMESQNVLNFWEKIANNKPYANGDFFIITKKIPIYVTTLFMTTYKYRLFVTNFGRFSTIF
jgi:hypothetical protein